MLRPASAPLTVISVRATHEHVTGRQPTIYSASPLAGALVAGILVAGLAGWAWTAELAGAVIAPGVVVVESEVKQVQHPTGGVVSEVNVRNETT